MKIFCIVPVKRLSGIKSRLSSILKPTDRMKLNLRMLEDVISSINASKSIDETIVVSPDKEVLQLARRLDVDSLDEKSEHGVNEAVRKATWICLDRQADSSLVLPSDIPLITSLDVDRIVGMADLTTSVVMTPSLRLDGTNALLRSPPTVMKTFYDQNSYTLHHQEALNLNLNFKRYLSRRVMLDLDTPADTEEFMRIESETLTHEFLKAIL